MPSDFSTVTKTPSIPQFAQNAAAGYNSGSLSYVVEATNNGSAVSAGNFVLTDTVNVPTNFLSAQPTVVILDNQILSASQYSYSMSGPNTLVVTVNVAVPAGATIMVIFGAQPQGTVPVGSNLSNTATVTDRGGGVSGSASASIPVVASTNASVSNFHKVASQTVVPPGGTVTYTITGTYTGASSNSPLQVMDYLFNDSTNQGVLLPTTPTTATATVNGQPRSISSSLTGSPTYNANLSTNMLLSGPWNNGDQFTISYTVTIPSTIPVGTYVENWIYASLDGVKMAANTNNQILIGYPTVTMSSLSKTVNPTLAWPGLVMAYTVSATNTGNGSTNPYSVTDNLPAGVTLIPNSTSATIGGNPVAAPTVSQSGQQVTFTFGTQVAPGQQVVLTYDVQVATDVTPGTYLTNYATIKGTATDPGQTVTSTATVGSPALTANKSSFPASVQPGANITYTINVSNASSAAATPSPWTIADTLPTSFNLNDQSIVATIGGVGISGITMTPNPTAPNYLITVPQSLQPGQTVNIAFSGAVASDAPVGSSFPNTASIENGPTVSDPNPPRILAPSFTDLQKSGSLNMPSSGTGGTITWTITATNQGPGIAPTTTIIDPLSNGQQYLQGSATATINGSPVPVDDSAGNGDQPVFTIDTPLQPGQSVTVTFTTSLPPVPQQLDPGTQITNAGTIKGYPSDGGTAIPAAPPLTLGSPDFSNGVKTNCCGEIAPGEIVEYTITVTNNGTLDSNPLIITDPLPTTLDANGNTVPLVTYTGAAPTATINNTGGVGVTVGGTPQTPVFTITQPVKPGQTVTLTFPALVNPATPLGTTVTNTAFIQGTALGTTYPTNPTTFITEATHFGNNTKTPSGTIVAPGSNLSYTLTTTNLGNAPTDAFTMTDTLDPNLAFDANTPVTVTVGGEVIPASAYTVTQNGQQLVMTITDPAYQLGPGETAQITFNTLVSESAPPGTAISNSATFATDSLGSNSNMTNSPPTTVGAPAFGDAAKNASTSLVNPGDQFNYWISATNTGNAPTNPFTITDAIPAGLFLTSMTATATVNGQTVPVTVSGTATNPTFTVDTPINPSDQVIITFPMTADADLAYGTEITNNAVLKGYPSDPGTSVANTITVGNPSFSNLSKTPSTNSISPGDPFTYTITATNNGTTPTLVTMGDPLPTAVTLRSDPAPTATIDGSATAVTVDGTATNPTFTMGDELQPGQTVTLTFSVDTDPNAINGTTFNNTITISAPDVAPSTASSVPVTVNTPVFNAVKLPSTQSVTPGQTLSYTLTGTNAGSATDNPFTITDTLPAGIVLANPTNLTATVDGQAVPVTVTGTDELTFTIQAAVGHNQDLNLTFDTTATTDVPAGETTFTNTATINAKAGQPGTTITGPPVAYGTPDFSGATKTAIDASGNPLDTTSPGGSILYKGEGTNHGTGVAVGPFKVTDTLYPGTTIDPTYPITTLVTLPDGSEESVPVTYNILQGANDQQTIVFNFPANVPIPVGATATMYFKVNLNPSIPAGTVIPNTMTGFSYAADPGSTSSTSNVTVASPDFSQASTKSADTGEAVPGQTLTYTVHAKNTGIGAASQFVLTDTLPVVTTTLDGLQVPLLYNPLSGATATLTNPDGSTTQADVVVTGSSLHPIFTVTDPATGQNLSIPPGATVNLSFNATVPVNILTPATLTNTADINGVTTVTSDPTTVNPPTSTNPTLKKSSEPTAHPGFNEIFPGEQVTYHTAWIAQNDADYITATDQMPPYAYLPTDAVATLTTTLPDGTVTITEIPNTGTTTTPIFQIPGPVQKGTQYDLTFIADTTPGIPLNTYLVNVINISDGTDSDYASDITDPDGGILVADPTFDVHKTSTPSHVEPGGTITYTLQALNTGTLSSNQFTMIDTLPAGLSASQITNVTATIHKADGTTEPTAITIGGTDQVPTFTPAAQLLPGDLISLDFDIPVPTTLAAGTVLINNLHVLGYPGAQGETATDDPGTTIGAADLTGTTFTKSVTPNYIPPGGQVNYSFQIHNPNALNTDLTLTDTLPPDVTVPSTTNANVTINGTTTQLTNVGTATDPRFIIPGPIPANADILVQFSAFLALDAPVPAQFQNAASLSNGGDTELAADDGDGFESRYIFDSEKTALQETVSPGGQVTYQITATNTGDQTAPEFVVSDLLPAGFEFTENDTVTATVGGVAVPVNPTPVPDNDSTPLLMSIQTPIPVGATVVLTFTVTATAAAQINETLTNLATIIAFPGDVGDTISDQGVLVKGGIQNDTIAKSACPTWAVPGDCITYTLTYTNTYDIAGDLVLTDTLSKGLCFPSGAVALLTQNGAVIANLPNTGTGNTLVFTIAGPIPAGTEIALCFEAQIACDIQTGCSISNLATLSDGFSTIDSNSADTAIHQLYATACMCQKAALLPGKYAPLAIRYHQQAKKQRSCRCCQGGNCQNRPIVLKGCNCYLITYTVTIRTADRSFLAKLAMTLDGRPIPCSEVDIRLHAYEKTTITHSFTLNATSKKAVPALAFTHFSREAIKVCGLTVEVVLLE